MLVGQRHPDDGADPGLQVLLGETVHLHRRPERVHHRSDRHGVEVEAGPTGELGRIGLGVVGRPLARVGDAEDVLRTQRVARDGTDERRVDAAGQPHQHGPEPVLAHVVPQAEDEGVVDLGEVLERRRDRGRHGVVRRDRLRREHRPAYGEPGEVPVGVGHRLGRGRQVEVDDEQLGHELLRPGHQLPGRVDHDRVAVEDQLVLTSEQVDVGQGADALAGSSRAQLEPHVVLVALVGRAVRDDEQARLGSVGRLGGTVLPQVLADRDRDVDAADLHDVDRVAGHEVADLVADAVVPQVVLGLSYDDTAVVQHRHGVLRRPLRAAEPLERRVHAVEEAGDDGDLAVPRLGEPLGQPLPSRRGRRPRTTAGTPGPRSGSRSGTSRG